jgi:uncharacterized protein (UPF0335 family)
MTDIREAVKKVWEHERRLEGFDLHQILRAIEKHTKDIENLKEWLARLEEMLANSGKGSSSVTDAQFFQLVKRVEKIEEKLAFLQKN